MVRVPPVLGLILLALLAACRSDSTPKEPAEQPYQPPVRSELQQTYSLLDELTLTPAPADLPSGFTVRPPGPTSFSVAAVYKPYDVVGEAAITLNGPGPLFEMSFVVVGNAAEAARLHADAPGLSTDRFSARFTPPGVESPAVCLTGTSAVEGRSYGATNCRVLVDRVIVHSRAFSETNGERGDDEAAVALVRLAVRHLEAARRAIAERAAMRPMGRVVTVGWLLMRAYHFGSATRRAVLERLGALGYERDRSLLVEYRFADEQPDRLPDLARELVGDGVDVIVVEGTSAARVAKAATDQIPIVFYEVNDPVAAGLVTSVSRPGGNVTGLSSSLPPDFVVKQLEVIKEGLPGATRIAVLAQGATPGASWPQLEASGASLGLELRRVGVANANDVRSVLATVPGLGVHALLDTTGLAVGQAWPAFLELQRARRIPIVTTGQTDYSLLSYSPNFMEQYRRVADYVDRLVKGAAPADLPVEGPTSFELLVNLREARRLELTLPQTFLAQATRVIE